MVRRYAAGAAVGTALVVSVTGCLGDSGKKASGGSAGTPGFSAASVLEQTSAKTSAITTFRTNISMTMSSGGQDIRMSGTAGYRLRPKLAMKLAMNHMIMNGRDMGGFEQILLGDTMYMKMPPVSSSSSSARPWVKVSLSRLGAGGDVQGMMGQSNTDPASAVKMFTASKDVRKVGEENVAGVSTTHYRGSFSMTDALAKLAPKEREDTRKSLGRMGIDTMNFDLWVDGKRLPRKMAMSTPSTSKLPMTVNMVYTGYNVPVSITAPPASQVRESGVPGVPG